MDAYSFEQSRRAVDKINEAARQAAVLIYRRAYDAVTTAATNAADQIVDRAYGVAEMAMAQAHDEYLAVCTMARTTYEAAVQSADETYQAHGGDSCDAAYQTYLDARFTAGAVYRQTCEQAHALADAYSEKARETARNVERAAREELEVVVERVIRMVAYEVTCNDATEASLSDCEEAN